MIVGYLDGSAVFADDPQLCEKQCDFGFRGVYPEACVVVPIGTAATSKVKRLLARQQQAVH